MKTNINEIQGLLKETILLKEGKEVRLLRTEYEITVIMCLYFTTKIRQNISSYG